MTCLYIVVPCYNEQEVLPETSKRLAQKMKSMRDAGLISASSRVVFVDDGSRDETWKMIEQLTHENTLFGGIKLSRNRGHQNALLCGLMTVCPHCDAAISIDADLQDDIEVLDQFVQKYEAGCDIVFGVRKDRSTDSTFKRKTAQSYYRFMQRLGTKLIYNHADFRLMSQRALRAMAEFGEVNLFLRGMVLELGFRTDCVYYDRAKRFAGESKYPLRKMLALAVEGITSFSVKPLKLINTVGVLYAFLGGAWLIAALVLSIMKKAAAAFAVAGSVWLCCGLILIAAGILGTYIGKIYMEVKHRPRYIVEKQCLNLDADLPLSEKSGRQDG